MWGVLKELLLIIALIALLLVAGSFYEPVENYLRTGRTCHEVVEHLAAKKYRNLTPAEETDLANCS